MPNLSEGATVWSQTTLCSATDNRHVCRPRHSYSQLTSPTHSNRSNQFSQTYQTSILALEQFWSPTVRRLGSQGVERLDPMRWGPSTHGVTSQPNICKGRTQRRGSWNACTPTAHQTLNWGSPRGTHRKPQQSKPFTQQTKRRFCRLQKWLANIPQSPFQILTGDNHYLSVLG